MPENSINQTEMSTPPKNESSTEYDTDTNPLERSQTMKGLVKKSTFQDIVYEFKPNLKSTFLNQPLETNSAGFRERELPKKKAEGVYRIIGLGDSVMFGWGVKSEESFLRVLEDKLNQRLKTNPNPKIQKFEVLNFGVPGYNTAMEVATYLHKAKGYEADLVLVAYVSNDLEVPLFMQKNESKWTLERSFLLDFIKDRLNQSSKKAELLELGFGRFDPVSRQKVIAQYEYMTGPGGYLTAMDKLRLELDGHPVLISYGSANTTMKKMITDQATKAGFETLEIKPFVDRYVERTGIPNTPEARKDLLQLNPKDPHPSVKGHEAYAEALYFTICDRFLNNL